MLSERFTRKRSYSVCISYIGYTIVRNCVFWQPLADGKIAHTCRHSCRSETQGNDFNLLQFILRRICVFSLCFRESRHTSLTFCESRHTCCLRFPYIFHFLYAWHLFSIQYRNPVVLFPGYRFVCWILSLCLKQWGLINKKKVLVWEEGSFISCIWLLLVNGIYTCKRNQFFPTRR